MTRTLDAWDLDETAQVARLLTSELVTNTILHARTEVDIHVVREGDRVRIEIEDHAGGTPAPVKRAQDATTGRGLQIVAGMASAWGVSPRDDGKVVWFEVPVAGYDSPEMAPSSAPSSS